MKKAYTGNMKRQIGRLGLAYLLLVGITNLPWPSDFLEMWVDHNHYKYSNGDATWLFTENLFKDGRAPFSRLLSYNPVAERRYPGRDTIIYRNFTKNPLAFWRYGKYLFDQRYTLPYISREQALKMKAAKGYTQ